MVECYHGVYAEEILAGLGRLLNPSLVIETKAALLEEASIAAMVQPFVTDDPVFGYITSLELENYFDATKPLRCNKRSAMLKRELFWSLERAHRCCVQIRHCLFMQTCRDGKYSYVLERTTSATLAEQTTVQHSLINTSMLTLLTGVFATVKRKDYSIIGIIFWIQQKEGSPKMIDATAFKAVMQVAVSRPFRVVPFFDPGPWVDNG